MEQLIFCYFNIRNFEISKYRSFYMSPFQILTPTRKINNKLLELFSRYHVHCYEKHEPVNNKYN